MTINEIRQQMEKEILHLDNAESITFYLVSLGQRNPGLNTSEKTDDHLVRGCHFKTWLKITFMNECACLSVDSNSTIVRGLGSLLMRLFNGQPVDAILNADINSLNQSNLRQFMGSQRREGLELMVRHVKDRIGKYRRILQ
jgi:cysteine desulfuration protein SufE